MNPNQLKQLPEKLAKVFNTDNIITPEDIAQVVEGIAQIIKVERENIKGISEEHKQTLQSVIETVSNEHDKILKEVKNTSQNAISEATEAINKLTLGIEEVKRIAKEVMEMKPENGLDADEDLIVEKVLAEIKLPEYKETVLDDGEQIRDKLTSLEGDKRLDISAIKGTDKLTTQANLDRAISILDQRTQFLVNKVNNAAGATAFTSLTDVPSSYSGQAGKAVRVNVGETGLEFFTASGTGTVTSVAATVPTGLTISGSPITAAGTLAIALDTGYVIPLQTTLDGKANTALSNLASVAINTSLISDTDNTDDLGSALIGWRTGYFSTSILTPKVTADTSAGLLLESANGTDVGLLGAGNTANVEWYGSHNFDTATANTIAIFGASKTLSSGTVGNSLSFSAGTLDTIQDIRTTANPQFATIELGAATDTTISRVSAGVIAVEGVTVATASNTLTLSGKTLTEPKFVDGGFIADANGNEMIIFDTVASAVNEITLANAATGANPKLSATGGDTNIGIDLQTKGTGVVNILGNSTQAGEVRIFEDTDNGTNYTGFKAPATLAGNVVYTLPSADGSSGQFISTNGSGTLSWATGGSSSFSGAKAYRTTDVSLTASVWATIDLDNEYYDTDTYHDNSTNPSRITIPATGKYRFTANTELTANKTHGVRLLLNGSAIEGGSQTAGNAGFAEGDSLSWENTFTSGDYVQMQVVTANTATSCTFAALSVQRLE